MRKNEKFIPQQFGKSLILLFHIVGIAWVYSWSDIMFTYIAVIYSFHYILIAEFFNESLCSMKNNFFLLIFSDFTESLYYVI